MNNKGNAFLIVCFIIIVLFSLCYMLGYAFTSGHESIVIKEKWVKYHGSDAKYLVSSQSGEVYEITDSWVRMRWDSSDLYALLQPNMSCIIDYQGWRAPFFSDYKNIISANCT